MKIAQIAPPWLTVPPTGYGGAEAVIGTLTDGLVERGHDVTLFASAGSRTNARLRAYYDQPLGTPAMTENPLLALPPVLDAYSRAGQYDLIHDHTFPIGPAIGSTLRGPPVVHTVHTPPGGAHATGIYELLSSRVALIAVSDAQRRSRSDLTFAAIIQNGIPLADYPVGSSKDDYLLFVGRMAPQKGVHLAVRAARQLGRRLVIAAKMTDPAEVRYFEDQVRPLMGDAVTFVGEVDHPTKVALYQRAACLLAPARWPEPFGLVMVESMACGTPVVAFREGAATEVVAHGVTGFLADHFDDFVAAIEPAGDLDPAACRRRVEEHFTADRMIDAYVRLFADIVARGRSQAWKAEHGAASLGPVP